MRRLILSLCAILILSGSASAKYYNLELKNGLEAYVEENHSLPIVNVTILYRVGCVDEYNSITGISHMLEHMNFRGSKHFLDGYIDKLTSKYGGVDNAQTSFDDTVYFATIDKSAWGKVLAFYADNMNNLTLNRSKFLKERSVVYQERLWRIDNSADGFLYYSLHNLSYVASPYRWTPIGFAYDIQHYTIGELRKYYKSYYAPNNAVIIISGDINKKAVFKKIKKLFGSKKRIEIVRHITKEPTQNGRRIMFIEKPASFKKLAVGFKIPREGSIDTPALDLISYMLFFGKSALAEKDLVRDRHIFVSIDGGNEGRIYDKGLYEIFGSIENGVSFKKARKSLLDELDKIKKGDFERKLLSIAKTKAISDYLFSKEMMSEKNMNFAFYAAFGMEQYYKDYINTIRSIRKKEIMKAAQKYFKVSKESDVFLTPQKGKQINSTFRGELR